MLLCFVYVQYIVYCIHMVFLYIALLLALAPAFNAMPQITLGPCDSVQIYASYLTPDCKSSSPSVTLNYWNELNFELWHLNKPPLSSPTVQGWQQEAPSVSCGLPKSPGSREELQPTDVWRNLKVSESVGDWGSVEGLEGDIDLNARVRVGVMQSPTYFSKWSHMEVGTILWLQHF